MIKKKRNIFIGYILIIIIVAIFTLTWQAYHIEKQMKEVESISDIVPGEVSQEKITTKLIPSRPEDYGMVVTNELDKPKTQAEWNEFLQQKLSEVKVQTSPETLTKIKEKIKEDPEKTQEKIAKIDKAIKECQEILQKEPNNEQIQAKLERLMILKGLGEQLPDL